MTSTPIRLGPFELRGIIGRGGMAEVWRAEHARQHVPVAIKVITARRAREPQFLSSFRHEVQAVARLNHPGVILVLDHGEVPEEAEEISQGRLRAGSPFLAMELASWGSLDGVPKPLRWSDLTPLLLSLLDALAHAHARGVIHRDLKPGNVLLSAPEDIRPGLKLTDFGIAHAFEEEVRTSEERSASGTPHFMAPEQFMGSWRDHGPWTDLYAVGCLAYVLATGRFPFEGDSAVQLAWAHLHQPPPPLERESLPEDFGQWIHRLMQKDPRQRFLRAADAGWALMRIIEARRVRGRPPREPPSPVPAEPFDNSETDPSRNVAFGTNLGIDDQHAATEVRAERELDAPPTLLDGPPTVPGKLAALGLTRPDRPSSIASAHQAERVPEHTGILVETIPPDLLALNDVHGPHTLATMIDALGAVATLPWLDPSSLSGVTPSAVTAYAPVDEERPLFPRRVPPLPPSWRYDASSPASMQLVGAGLGLYGLRSIPMVDRDAERDLIWARLRHVRQTRCAHAIVLRGAGGVGKSAIVEWMTQRADEVGSANVLKATHAPIPGPSDGLSRMVSRFLRCIDLPRSEVLARTETMLRAEGISDAYEWQALTELVYPTPFPDLGRGEDVVRFSNATERHVLVRRLLERAANERPVIVWLDDLQWGSDATAFTLHLLESQSYQPRPILVLATVREEALEDRRLEKQLLDELCASELCSEHVVGPLAHRDQKSLVSELLVLDADLASRVADRTDGNPLFAVQLVGDWVARGALDVGEDGFVVARFDEGALPDNIHQVWTQRLDRILVDYSSSARRALELAAVLGGNIDPGEWGTVCRLTGADIPEELLRHLIQTRLLTLTDGSWAFAHGMLRESLERAAREANRHASHHVACADTLVQKYGRGAPGISERVGGHLIAAGEPARALAPLLAGAREKLEKSEFSAARALLEQREKALADAHLPSHDPQWGSGWVLWARVHLLQGQLDEAQACAERAEHAAVAHDWRAIRPEALAALAEVAYERGDQRRAIESYEDALALFEPNGDLPGVLQCLFGLGEAVYRLGDHARAETYYQRGLEIADPDEDPVGVANLLSGQGFVEIWRGDLDEALRCFERQHRILEAQGDRFKLARCVSALGEVARQAGRFEVAEAHYRRALAIDEAIGSASAWIDKLNIGLVLIARGEYRSARELVETVHAKLHEKGEPAQLCVVHVELLPCLAVDEEWDRFDDHLAQIAEYLTESGMTDGDLAWLLQTAGDRALERDRPRRAVEAYRLATAQWRAIERHDKVELVEAAILRTQSTDVPS